MHEYVYDIETYPNVFTMAVINPATNRSLQLEISEYRNDYHNFYKFMCDLSALRSRVRMVGFNNIGFDYPVIHWMMQQPHVPGPLQIYQRAQEVITGDRWEHQVKPWNWIVPQLDLFLIHHFDNSAKSTSLKNLEFNMLSPNVADLPYPVGSYLTPEQIGPLHEYNLNDVIETARFLEHSRDMITLRESFSERFGRDFLNDNDTKIGAKYFVMRMEEKSPGICYTERREPRQTWRSSINIGDIIFPYIQFDNPEFERIRRWLSNQTVTETKSVFKKLTCTVDDMVYKFGTGGIHASRLNYATQATPERLLLDFDVKSYYPSLCIANRIYPEHLSELFCDVNSELFNERAAAAQDYIKAMLKLAMNGTYGKTNSVHSPFYDPQYMLAITINGQLLLCVLSETLMKIPGVRIVQVNTDGLTLECPVEHEADVMAVTDWWQRQTLLTLERTDYSRMFIRDVNSYIAETVDGKVKRKGAYRYTRPWEDDADLKWSDDHSGLVIAKAANAFLLDGEDIGRFIRTHPDPYDFMMRARVNKSTRLVHRVQGGDIELPKTSRYYVSTAGGALIKIMPELPSKPGSGPREIGIDVGYSTMIANQYRGEALHAVNYDYYIQETYKLVKMVTEKGLL